MRTMESQGSLLAPGGAPPGGVIAGLLRHRFTILLATLLALLLVAPVGVEALASTAPGAASWGGLLVSACLVLAGILAVGGHRRVLKFGLGLAIPVLLLDLATLWLWPGQLALVRHGTRVLFVGFVIVELLRHLFRPRRITFDTISASLCVYLLLGVWWANVFTVIETAAPGSFVETAGQHGGPTAWADEGTRSFRLLYFSYVTLSSVGYGDILPRTTLARMCAITEAMMGQGYLLIMVSRLVGIQVSQSQSATATQHPPS
jgi:hypothetical protein